MPKKSLPLLDRLDLRNCPLFMGYYSLGLIEKNRPDISLIPLRLARQDQWTESDRTFCNLEQEINTALSQNKTVFVVPWEEDIMGEPDPVLTNILNKYQHRSVYFITEMDSEGQKLYTFQHNIKCKLLELPFVLVNDILAYNKIRSNLELAAPPASQFNYLCMIGRPESHKFALAQSLIDHNLDQAGLITVMSEPPESIKKYCKRNSTEPRYPNSELLTKHRKEAAQIKIKDVWCSSNVENFLHIEQTYDMPLIVHSESTVGIFPATEKSIWPVLLGKLYLIHGRPGIMSWIQRFCPVDQKRWANIEFDSVGGYSQQDHDMRLQLMIQRNQQLIISAADIYQQLKPDLEMAKVKFVQNLYDFFANQINLI